MAITLVVDTHEIKEKFLWQYRESTKFQKYVQSFIQPAFLDIEAQFFSLINDRSLDHATGANLRLWADMFDIPYTGQSDEELRDSIYWASAEKFGTGSIYEVRAFFEKWYRASKVEVKELGNGEVELRIIDGQPKNDSAIVDWPCFPPGMAQIKSKSFTPSGIVFSFAEDNDPDGSGFGIITRVAQPSTSPPLYTFPSASVTGQVIWVDYNLNVDVLNVKLNFKVELAKGVDLETAFKSYFQSQPSDESTGGLISFVDRNGTEWEFMALQAFASQPTLVTRVDDVSTSTVSIQCVKDNVSWVDLRVSGVSLPYIYVNGFSGWFPALSAYNGGASESTIWQQKNPSGLTTKYTITEKPGIGGRFTVQS